MKIDISYDSGRPMYEQIENSIKESVYNGELKNNDLLPSIRQLARDLNVSMITTKRAYSDLENEGFVYTISGKGTFIKVKNFEKFRSERKNKLLKQINENIKECYDADIKKSRILVEIDKIYGGNSDE